ncbi:MAG TPA: hypothetical protein VFV38_35670 [Ktedonobacteraceae bacterium]|nr:hypothetical protein [Ktedonobacteraceae bacterium]
MNSPPSLSVTIQTSSASVPAVPAWCGEVAVTAHALRRLGVLATIEERVRFARRRFGQYKLIDFVVMLLGYAISSERTLEAFYESLRPFATPFMALFGRERLPHRSTLSRFLAALNQAAVEALRTVFLEDLLARPLEFRTGNRHIALAIVQKPGEYLPTQFDRVAVSLLDECLLTFLLDTLEQPIHSHAMHWDRIVSACLCGGHPFLHMPDNLPPGCLTLLSSA